MRKLSELAGISNPYLSQIERGLRKPSAEILQQIAKALRISAETLYVRAGILDERDEETPDLEREISRDPSIVGAAEGDAARGVPLVPRRRGNGRPTPGRAVTDRKVGWLLLCRSGASPCSACTRRRWPSPDRATAAA